MGNVKELSISESGLIEYVPIFKYCNSLEILKLNKVWFEIWGISGGLQQNFPALTTLDLDGAPDNVLSVLFEANRENILKLKLRLSAGDKGIIHFIRKAEQLPHLTNFTLSLNYSKNAQSFDHFIPELIKCSRLKELELIGGTVTKKLLKSISSIQSLQNLQFDRVDVNGEKIQHEKLKRSNKKHEKFGRFAPY